MMTLKLVGVLICLKMLSVNTHTHNTETSKTYVYFAEITSEFSLCSYYVFIYFIINILS